MRVSHPKNDTMQQVKVNVQNKNLYIIPELHSYAPVNTSDPSAYGDSVIFGNRLAGDIKKA